MDPYNTVREFENAVAKYAGSAYAVAVDTCSAALFLCCKYLKVKEVAIPSCTHVSVPCAIIHAGGAVKFKDYQWKGMYYLEPYPIVDSACRFTSNMYEKGTYWCVSFQYRKHLPIGRGGMILTDNKESYEWFKLARFFGRHEIPLEEDVIEMVGWNFYMEPERAARGLTLMLNLSHFNDDLSFHYPDLSKFSIYTK